MYANSMSRLGCIYIYVITILLLQFTVSTNSNNIQSLLTLEDYYSYSKGGAKERFENKFKKICLKYSFVKKYVNILLNSNNNSINNNYMIFVFHENGKHNHGGLGDRLAGMITATAYAIRSNRILLIQGDKAFEESFRPYYPSDFKINNNSINTNSNNDNTKDDSKSHHHNRHTSTTLYPTWKSWDWAGWKHSYSSNMTKLHCINPIPESTICALDKIKTFRNYKVIKYYGNRVYLCRWYVHPKLKSLLSSELSHTLGINNTAHVNLYEVAGCLLRLAIWPTDKLWKALDETMYEQFLHRHQQQQQQQLHKNSNNRKKDSGDDTMKDTQPTSSNNHITSSSINNNSSINSNLFGEEDGSMGARTDMQIGFHFRCGDSSFTTTVTATSTSTIVKHNPECYYESKETWRGTSFSDDRSIDSPIDHAICGQTILSEFSRSSYYTTTSSNNNKTIVIDKPNANTHMYSNNMKYVLAYIASDNRDSSDQINNTLRWGYTVKPPQSCHMDLQRNAHCTLSTSLQWFMLSLSDVIITQALIKPKPSVYDDVDMIYSEAAPVSAFSRYASIYALSSNSIRYGKGCKEANQTILSYESHGNWVCNPQMFY